jgi:hypothetical protein
MEYKRRECVNKGEKEQGEKEREKIRQKKNTVYLNKKKTFSIKSKLHKIIFCVLYFFIKMTFIEINNHLQCVHMYCYILRNSYLLWPKHRPFSCILTFLLLFMRG